MTTQGFSRILLATDGSEQAAGAVNVAMSFAWAAGGSVRVVHVWNLEVHHRHGVWDVEMRSEAERLINETVTRLRAGGVRAEGEVLRADDDHIAAAVREAARQFEADLVIVGSRGLSDWQSMIKHSVSHQLLSSVDCPLLIVRGQPSGSAHLGQRVLLAIAGGDDIAPAACAAIAAASAPGSEVLVVHVAQVIVGSQGFAYVEPDDDIHRTIEQATTLLKESGVVTEAMVAHAGPVAEVIRDISANWQADIIVIGSSRMGDLGSLVLGSVTHDLLRATERPVLVAERVRA